MNLRLRPDETETETEDEKLCETEREREMSNYCAALMTSARRRGGKAKVERK